MGGDSGRQDGELTPREKKIVLAALLLVLTFGSVWAAVSLWRGTDLWFFSAFGPFIWLCWFSVIYYFVKRRTSK